jgi:ketosteroid isomerase-like protein
MTAPGDIEGTARGVLDQWRLAYESRNTEALARLYAHDASLSVVEDGGRRLGWTEVEPMLRDRLGKASSLHIRIEDVQIRAQGTTAIVVATVLRERSAPDASTDRGVLTLVLRAPEAGDAGWVIVAEHDSHRGS